MSLVFKQDYNLPVDLLLTGSYNIDLATLGVVTYGSNPYDPANTKIVLVNGTTFPNYTTKISTGGSGSIITFQSFNNSDDSSSVVPEGSYTIEYEVQIAAGGSNLLQGGNPGKIYVNCIWDILNMLDPSQIPVGPFSIPPTPLQTMVFTNASNANIMTTFNFSNANNPNTLYFIKYDSNSAAPTLIDEIPSDTIPALNTANKGFRTFSLSPDGKTGVAFTFSGTSLFLFAIIQQNLTGTGYAVTHAVTNLISHVFNGFQIFRNGINYPGKFYYCNSNWSTAQPIRIFRVTSLGQFQTSPGYTQIALKDPDAPPVSQQIKSFGVKFLIFSPDFKCLAIRSNYDPSGITIYENSDNNPIDYGEVGDTGYEYWTKVGNVVSGTGITSVNLPKNPWDPDLGYNNIPGSIADLLNQYRAITKDSSNKYHLVILHTFTATPSNITFLTASYFTYMDGGSGNWELKFTFPPLGPENLAIGQSLFGDYTGGSMQINQEGDNLTFNYLHSEAISAGSTDTTYRNGRCTYWKRIGDVWIPYGSPNSLFYGGISGVTRSPPNGSERFGRPGIIMFSNFNPGIVFIPILGGVNNFQARYLKFLPPIAKNDVVPSAIDKSTTDDYIINVKSGYNGNGRDIMRGSDNAAEIIVPIDAGLDISNIDNITGTVEITNIMNTIVGTYQMQYRWQALDYIDSGNDPSRLGNLATITLEIIDNTPPPTYGTMLLNNHDIGNVPISGMSFDILSTDSLGVGRPLTNLVITIESTNVPGPLTVSFDPITKEFIIPSGLPLGSYTVTYSIDDTVYGGDSTSNGTITWNTVITSSGTLDNKIFEPNGITIIGYSVKPETNTITFAEGAAPIENIKSALLNQYTGNNVQEVTVAIDEIVPVLLNAGRISFSDTNGTIRRQIGDAVLEINL